MKPEFVAGCDMGVPAPAGQQARKIILIEAERTATKRYRIREDGRNARLTGAAGRAGWYQSRRGWTLPDLAETLKGGSKLTSTGLDFPFSIPLTLLACPAFAGAAGHQRAFGTRNAWARFTAAQLPLQFVNDNAGARLDFNALAGWKNKDYWKLRSTDSAINAQPPLKHIVQCLFNMTIAGASLLSDLEIAGAHIMLRPAYFEDVSSDRTLFETYPGGISRAVGFAGNYKQDPHGAMAAARSWLWDHGIQLEESPAITSFCEQYRTGKDDPDAADAFLCLIAAIAWREDLWEAHPGNANEETLLQEGCIITPV